MKSSLTIADRVAIKSRIKDAEKQAEQDKIKYWYINVQGYGIFLAKGTSSYINKLIDDVKEDESKENFKHEIPEVVYNRVKELEDEVAGWMVAVLKYIGEEKMEEFHQFKKDLKAKRNEDDIMTEKIMQGLLDMRK